MSSVKRGLGKSFDKVFGNNEENYERINIICDKCQRKTNHRVLRKITKSRSYGEEGGGESTDYCIVDCLECRNVCFYEKKISSDLCHIEYDEENKTWYEIEDEIVNIYPRVKLGYGRLLNRNNQVPDLIKYIYEETCDAIANKNYILASSGIRTLIEAFCNVNQIKSSLKLMDKINCLKKQGIVSIKEYDKLHALRFLGNEAVHNKNIPTEKQILLAISIIERILESNYLCNDAENILIMPFNSFFQYQKFMFLQISKLKKNSKINIDAFHNQTKEKRYQDGDIRINDLNSYLIELKKNIINMIDNKSYISIFSNNNDFSISYKINKRSQLIVIRK